MALSAAARKMLPLITLKVHSLLQGDMPGSQQYKEHHYITIYSNFQQCPFCMMRAFPKTHEAILAYSENWPPNIVI